MRKGKLGVVLCLYPILGFICVIVNLPVVCALLFGFVLLAERDEWAGRQTLQALGLSAVTVLLERLLRFAGGLVPLSPYSSGFFTFLSVMFNILAGLVYLAAIVVSIVAIVRVMKGQEANLPGLSALAYRAYGRQKPRPQPFPGQYPPPYAPGQPPYPPYPPQGQPVQPPPYQPPQNGGPGRQ